MQCSHVTHDTLMYKRIDGKYGTKASQAYPPDMNRRLATAIVHCVTSAHMLPPIHTALTVGDIPGTENMKSPLIDNIIAAIPNAPNGQTIKVPKSYREAISKDNPHRENWLQAMRGDIEGKLKNGPNSLR